MPRASSAGHEEGETWLPVVVDCGVCETTHALDGRGCPFEGSRRASFVAIRNRPVPVSDIAAGATGGPGPLVVPGPRSAVRLSGRARA